MPVAQAVPRSFGVIEAADLDAKSTLSIAALDFRDKSVLKQVSALLADSLTLLNHRAGRGRPRLLFPQFQWAICAI